MQCFIKVVIENVFTRFEIFLILISKLKYFSTINMTIPWIKVSLNGFKIFEMNKNCLDCQLYKSNLFSVSKDDTIVWNKYIVATKLIGKLGY